MDKKKKKAKRKGKAAANAAEAPVVNHSQEQHRSRGRTSSIDVDDHDVPRAFVQSSQASELIDSNIEPELRREGSGHSATTQSPLHLETEEPHTFDLLGGCKSDSRPDEADNIAGTDFCSGENLDRVLFDSCTSEDQVERAQMQALIIQMAQMQALAQEKEQIVRELEELQEALSIERETAELLRHQMTYLQGHIAERDVLEIGTHTEIQRLTAENATLQSQVADLTEKVKKLEEERDHLEDERGNLEQESRRVMLKKEQEGGEMVTELRKRVGKLEQEREDLEEERMKLEQESRQMMLKIEQEGEKLEQFSRQMTMKMEAERENLEHEIRQMTVKMEQEREKLEMERQQMRAKLEQERVKFDQENRQNITNLAKEGAKLDKEKGQLMLKLEEERETFYQERNQMKKTMEQQRNMLEMERRQLAEKVAQEREQMQQEYGQVIAKMEKDQEMLEHDRKQISAKMTALETGLEQLEREASVRARVFKDLATATEVDSSKKWESWSVYGKDPLAEAVAVAEEARMQRMAISQTVDKLLAENVELMSKVNEQASLINDLTKRAKPPDVKGLTKVNAAKEKVDVKEVSGKLNKKFMHEANSEIYLTKADDLGDHGDQMNGHGVLEINGNIDERDDSIQLSNNKFIQTSTTMGSPKINVTPETSPAMASKLSLENSGSSESLTTLYEITEIRVQPGPVSHRTQKEQPVRPDRSPDKKNSLIKAPIRFWSFVAGYMSGADLVKQ